MNKETKFKEAYEENRNRIYRICCCYVQDKDIRMDVYQEVLINIWNNFDSFKGKSQLSTWIYRITVNTCLGYIKKEKKTKKFYDRESEVENVGTVEIHSKEVQEEFDKSVETLYACINKLSTVDKTFISLFMEDISTDEIAEILGISKINARVKLSRIKKNLKEIWEKTNNGF